ncbi:hypothetical protein QUB05_26285 [Microcoleus sp. F10-C6]|uniref:hypothetical protein n=1 Tax=unclassified Microcoleus TaxID=2642155 RepID=UPI002FD57A83
MGISLKTQHTILAVTTALTVALAATSPLFTSGKVTEASQVDPYLGEYDEESYPIGIQIEELEGNRKKSQ